MRKKHARFAGIMLGLGLAATSMADLSAYSQNFETLNASSPTALSGDGWKVFANVFSPSWGYLYGYGTFPAPNGGPGFSAVASGEGGPNQGQQYINVYSDYNNGDHAIGNIIEANVFQEQTIGVADLGRTFSFEFDYKASSTLGPAGATTTFAFIKVLNPAAGYSLVANPSLNTTAASTSVWSEGNALNLTIDNAWTGHILQFGFLSYASHYENSGIFYDNLSFSAVPEPASLAVLAMGALTLLRKRRN